LSLQRDLTTGPLARQTRENAIRIFLPFTFSTFPLKHSLFYTEKGGMLANFPFYLLATTLPFNERFNCLLTCGSNRVLCKRTRSHVLRVMLAQVAVMRLGMRVSTRPRRCSGGVCTQVTRPPSQGLFVGLSCIPGQVARSGTGIFSQWPSHIQSYMPFCQCICLCLFCSVCGPTVQNSVVYSFH
jgi:hypothetical protein